MTNNELILATLMRAMIKYDITSATMYSARSQPSEC